METIETQTQTKPTQLKPAPYDLAKQLYQAGISVDRIRQQLLISGAKPEQADFILRRLTGSDNPTAPEAQSRPTQTTPAVRSRGSTADFVLGTSFLLCGAVITVGSFMAAHHGKGGYVVAIVPIFLGARRLLRGFGYINN